jgi:hypothetical protein
MGRRLSGLWMMIHPVLRYQGIESVSSRFDISALFPAIGIFLLTPGS